MARRLAVTPQPEPEQIRTPSVGAERPAPLVDPRDGDIEADASSTESRSLLAIAGNLLVEVSLPKFAAAFCLLVVVPALLLGITPLLASVWWNKVQANGVRGIGAIILLAFLLAVGWFGGRKLFRLVESSFWSLNAMAIQPAYVLFREGLLHLGGRITSDTATEKKEMRIRVVAKILAALLLCALACAACIPSGTTGLWSTDSSSLPLAAAGWSGFFVTPTVEIVMRRAPRLKHLGSWRTRTACITLA